jgi:hypothetical protein
MKKFLINYCYSDMGGSRAVEHPQLEIIALNKEMAIYFYMTIFGYYKHKTYEQFTKLPKKDKEWGIACHEIYFKYPCPTVFTYFNYPWSGWYRNSKNIKTNSNLIALTIY